MCKLVFTISPLHLGHVYVFKDTINCVVGQKHFLKKKEQLIIRRQIVTVTKYQLSRWRQQNITCFFLLRMLWRKH